mmetsp:Transcript_5364/g.10256  ORF Transcript_5364/g.10256 Transcript_5364/m.10256 type:complete len:148 (-) Transcript_5364:1674-2117(-)
MEMRRRWTNRRVMLAATRKHQQGLAKAVTTSLWIRLDGLSPSIGKAPRIAKMTTPVFDVVGEGVHGGDGPLLLMCRKEDTNPSPAAEAGQGEQALRVQGIIAAEVQVLHIKEDDSTTVIEVIEAWIGEEATTVAHVDHPSLVRGVTG